MIALRLDEDLERRFNELIETEGKNRSQVIRELIEGYLESKSQNSGEVFKSKFKYFEGELEKTVKRKPLTKSELKEKIRQSIVE